MKLRFCLGLALSAGLILCSQSVWAEYYWPNGFYVAGGGVFGYSLFHLDGTLTGSSTATLAKNKFKDGAAGFTLKVGFMPKPVPFQFEVAYSHFGNFTFNVNPLFSTTGSVPTYNNIASKLRIETLFANGYYNIPFYPKFWPYVGVGFGGARARTSLTATNAAGNTLKVIHSKTNTAFQAIAGVNIKAMDNVLIYLAYHFMDLGKAQWGPWSSGADQTTLTSKTIFMHEGEVGVKIFLGDQTPYQPPTLMRDED
ncbi:MAG: outer membrane beta-barrel protein [Gammaproteobacteria bacterium]|jgi:opacity protein-like surface antigen